MWQVGGQTVTWGVKCNDGISRKLDRQVRSILISEHLRSHKCPYHYIWFYDAQGKEINPGFNLFTSYYNESYRGETKKIPDGYDLIGFAIKEDSTGAIETIGFTYWKKPQI